MSNQRGHALTSQPGDEDLALLILAVDTTSQRRSIALAKGNQMLGMLAADGAGTHSWQLHDEIDLLLKKLDLRLDQMDVFGVTTGPGSFTGLRVGLAAIKGLAHSLSKPVVGVSSLEAVARSSGVSGPICACIDALRGEIYAQLFEVNPDGSVNPLTEPNLALPSHVYASLADEPAITFVGDGALSSLEILKDEAAILRREVIVSPVAQGLDEGWVVIQTAPFLAPAVASLAATEYQAGHTQTAMALAALYVRASDAEVKRRTP
ncbi:MAG: tRNA (adenosine(37)-N6)-threonylcarbamoyltransferase complex dimerization subunit type 1 TsaB [Acidobacteria bacterium]|nr:tRNA (adenosine(37)-N6)-threonylcarbamoyltransferase complex dimerization subunit type 1 TsaB [Acidobacteriota bacterium]